MHYNIAKLIVTERQLRNGSVATGVEAAPLNSESCHDSTELDCNVAGSETLGNKESNTQYLPIVEHQNMSNTLFSN
jgi:hypothetical protein